jgi:hypothetical protein
MEDDAAATRTLAHALALTDDPCGVASAWSAEAGAVWAALGHGVPKSAAGSAHDVGDWIAGHSRGAVAFPGPLRASVRPEMLAWDWLDAGLSVPGLDVRGVRASLEDARSAATKSAHHSAPCFSVEDGTSTCAMHVLHADAAGALYAVPLPLSEPEAEGEEEEVLAAEAEADSDVAWEEGEVHEELVSRVESPPPSAVRRTAEVTVASSPVSPPGKGARGRLALGTPGRGAAAAVRGKANSLLSLSVSGSRLL